MVTRALLVLTFVLAGCLWLAIDTTRDYLQHQLNANAQNSANSLALALQPHLAEKDLLAADTMIMAQVETGYYSAIELRDAHGDILAEHHLDTIQPHVPELFVALLPLRPPAATAAINSGWDLLAHISVSAYPGFAYQQLWRLTLGILGLGLAGAALAVAMALHWSRRKQRLYLAQQQSLNQEITALRREALRDEQTGLGNRRAFERQLRRILIDTSGTTSTGNGKHLLVIHLSSFADVIRSLGRWAVDEYLETMVALLRRRLGTRLSDAETTEDSVGASAFCLFRTDDSELALLGNLGKREAVCALSRELCDEFSALATDLYPHGFGSIGIVPIEAMQTVPDILSSGDIALRQAERTGINRWCYLLNGSPYPEAAINLETSE